MAAPRHSKGITMIDHTHDPAAQSWVSSAREHEQFPLQNLPMGVLDVDGGRIVAAIGDQVLDMRAALDAGLLSELGTAARQALQAQTLNAWMALPMSDRLAIRHAVFALLVSGSPAAAH